MNKLKNLSFENISATKFNDELYGERIGLTVVENNEILSMVVGKEMSLKDFVSQHFYREILVPELKDTFDDVYNVLSNEDKQLINKNLSVKDFIKFLNDKYEEYADEFEILNSIFETYENLVNYSSDNHKCNTSCFVLDSIETLHDGTGAGTLLINYLKENYDFIYLYSIMDIESYFKDKVDFKEIINGFMYWSNKEKLKEIL